MQSSRNPIVLLGVALAALSCGGESTPAAPTPTPTPVVLATPTPVPTPTPTPSPTPCPGCGLNTNPPARLNLRLYSIEDPSGRPNPAGNVCTNGCPSTGADIRIGWTARLDVIAKDADNRETFGSELVEFFVSNPDVVWVRGEGSTHQRRLQATGLGSTQVWAIQQGVRSGTLSLNFIP